MRQIKFRGKPYFGSVTADWIVGLLTRKKIRSSDKIVAAILTDRGETVPVKANTIGQFTELVDINGKEIYEGDIVQTHNVWKVVWQDFAFRMISLDEELAFQLCEFDIDYANNVLRDARVVGNIHEEGTIA